MSRKRILFVDDEAPVLDAFRRLMSHSSNGWDAVYATGGVAAINELMRSRFDIVVCDIRMPEVDGQAVLKKAKSEHPAAVRIVLAERDDRDAVMRVVQVAQQFVTKPCDGPSLRTALERASLMQNLLADEAVRQVVGKLEKLPSLPVAYWALTRALADAEADVSKVARIVEKDPAMCGKIMQLVNSAFFGLSSEVTSIQAAVAFLGFELLKGLALTASVFAAAEVRGHIEGFSLERLQRSSLLTARLARSIAQGTPSEDEAFTAGLLHDVGKLVLAMGMPRNFTEAARLGEERPCPVYEIEREIFGVTHAQAGGYLLGVWGLPLPIVEAVACHHLPCEAADSAFGTLATVHVADALIEELFHVPKGRAYESRLDEKFIEHVGVTERIPEWRAAAREIAIASGVMD
ncbi:MAG: HDOD domain-containing protein [Candidatus Eiseniibacteriota bacterium]